MKYTYTYIYVNISMAGWVCFVNIFLALYGILEDFTAGIMVIPVIKCLGSPPPFISHGVNGHLEGVSQPYLRDLRSPWVVNHFVSPGMILQVRNLVRGGVDHRPLNPSSRVYGSLGSMD